VSEYLGLLRSHGLELCECKRIDAHAYHKARYTLYGGEVDDLRTVIEWLEAQPDWTDFEFFLPDCCKEEIREQEMLGREVRRYLDSIGEGINDGNRSERRERRGNKISTSRRSVRRRVR
jgi:hypothetical protein